METLDIPVLRELPLSPAVLERAEGDASLGRMIVRFSKLGNWYPIRSWWEGDFMERIAPGAFTETMKELGPEGSNEVRTMFNHGHDAVCGGRSLGTIVSLREEGGFAASEVDLFDTTYNRDLVPALRAGAYGSSFMFEVVSEEINSDVERSDENPDGLPERTITKVRLFEQGPVVWPANPGATAGMARSATDGYYSQLERMEPDRFGQLKARAVALRSQRETITKTSGPTAGQRAAQLRSYQINALRGGR